jgi:asparagine synthase (glutamine-hydrolysing)
VFDYDKGANELGVAKEIATKFNTEHHEVHISGNDIIDVIEQLVNAHDEPFGDAADIPLYLLTRKLKDSIKVVLQGDGGDEFFGGYSRYNTISNANKWSKFSFLSNLISALGIKNSKVLRLQRFLNAISQKESYKRNALLLTMESKFTDPLRVFNKEFRDSVRSYDPFKRFKEVYELYDVKMNARQALFYTDTQTILKDTYFEKVDKATMANSIEVRVPFIDKDLAQFALSIPASLKTKNGQQKYLLKKSLEGVIPDKVLYGKKKGFGVPYAYWLQTSLSDYFIQQISTEKAANYLNNKEIINMFKLHKKGKGNFGFLLWKTMIFAVWINKTAGI